MTKYVCNHEKSVDYTRFSKCFEPWILDFELHIQTMSCTQYTRVYSEHTGYHMLYIPVLDLYEVADEAVGCTALNKVPPGTEKRFRVGITKLFVEVFQ